MRRFLRRDGEIVLVVPETVPEVTTDTAEIKRR
jgi:hypothetical protein